MEDTNFSGYRNVHWETLKFVIIVTFSGLVLLKILAQIRIKRASSEEALLLVTAHPDDEVTFFTPTLRSFDPKNIYLLCLSNGNAFGLGKVREIEVKTCCYRQFGIPLQNIHVINNEVSYVCFLLVYFEVESSRWFRKTLES